MQRPGNIRESALSRLWRRRTARAHPGGGAEILSGQTQWMGEFGLRKEDATDYQKSAKTARGIFNDAEGCFSTSSVL
ncbi:hypothetical protein [Bacteroides acidifaciens]|uniref:hypothetical protein n=1 Tax=Bacteroides acidifaciens TaxID=85831 RepID=UPI00242E7B51|nr:hypothetical protein [Bacteroides acidifaciens]